MRKPLQNLEETSINLTPLIDVVFVILIMFIVVAPLLEIDRIELAPNLLSKLPAQLEHPITIHVLADNTILLNKHPVSLKQLEQQLMQMHARYAQTHPQLIQDQRATFGTYQSVKNVVELSGFSTLDVLLKPH